MSNAKFTLNSIYETTLSEHGYPKAIQKRRDSKPPFELNELEDALNWFHANYKPRDRMDIEIRMTQYQRYEVDLYIVSYS